MSTNNKWLAVLAVLLIASIGVNAFFALAPEAQPNPICPPLQPNEPPPVDPAPVDPAPVDPAPVDPPLDLVPVTPATPSVTKEAYWATVKITNAVGDQVSTGSGMLVHTGKELVVLTTNVLFIKGIGDVLVTDAFGNVHTGTEVKVDNKRYIAAIRLKDYYGSVYTVLTGQTLQVGPKEYWTFGYGGGNKFTGATLYVDYHPLPSKSWTVFQGSDESVLNTYFGGPVLNTNGVICGMLLGRATYGSERVANSQLGINSKELILFLGEL